MGQLSPCRLKGCPHVSPQVIFVSISFSIATTATAKISLLCLYRRIFTTKTFRRNSLLLGLLAVGYWVASTLGSIFQCSPVQAAYVGSLSGRCINYAAFFFGFEIVNCLLDILLLCLPLQVIQTLQMSTSKKVQLSFIFVLGSL